MRSRWFGVVVAALAAALSIVAYPRLPATVAIHWDPHGQPNGYSSRLLAALLMPIVILAMTGLFHVPTRRRCTPPIPGRAWSSCPAPTTC
ncbi:MAG TPA: DUF1648 domain-containing protein [Gemmatimonadales bacterium]|nr:DUF1648 domain-containing protein [Gemmatimonadales bacterium]